MVEPTNNELEHGYAVDGINVLRALGLMLSPDERNPKPLVDLILLDRLSTEERLRTGGLAELDDETKAWLLVSAVYTGARGLKLICEQCRDSRVAAEVLASFFALSHLRPWRETAFRIAIAFSTFAPKNQAYCHSLIDKFSKPSEPEVWEIGTIIAASEGGPQAVLEAFERFAPNIAGNPLSQSRIASFRQWYSDEWSS